MESGGIENLFDKSRRQPNLKNRVDELTEQSVLDYALDYPAHGQVRVSNELRKVGKENCVRFEGLILQTPSDLHRYHYVKAKVHVHRYLNGSLAVFHGPRKLAQYDEQGIIQPTEIMAAA